MIKPLKSYFQKGFAMTASSLDDSTTSESNSSNTNLPSNPKTVSFYDVITSRRSVRRFTNTAIPDDVLDACLDMAMLAPNSSNLQPWEFYLIDSPEIRNQTIKYCMNQNAARTANRLIAILARTDTWLQNTKDNIKYYPIQPAPKAVKDYYGKLIPLAFARGPMNILSPAKYITEQMARQFKGAMNDFHYKKEDIKTWAIANTMLAAENLMLAIRSYGFDSCAMGSFDDGKMRKLLNLTQHQHIVMILAVGERAEKGIYAPQYRFERDRFIKKV